LSLQIDTSRAPSMTNTTRAERTLRIAIALARLAIVQFVILCLASMWLRRDRFDIVNDYLSTLGAFRSVLSLSAWLFNSSLIVLGCGLFTMFRALGQATGEQADDLKACGVAGMAAAIAIACIGLIPLSTSEGWHTFAMALWLFFTVLALLFWADWRRSERTRRPTSLGMLGVAAIAVYPLAVPFGRGPAVQKAIVLLTLIWLISFTVQVEQTIRSGAVRRWQSGRRKRRPRAMRVRIVKSPLGSAEDGMSRRPRPR
jgi:hypothetical membrane protein